MRPPHSKFSESPTAQKSAALERALSGYDADFEQQLLDRIITTIVDASLIEHADGRKTLALRLGESASALTTALACVLAMSPAAAHNTAAIKETSRRFRRKLHTQVDRARRDPGLHDFLRRSFNHTDKARGGRA
jgi:hypothetical protein